ncbi:MAG: electron transport complex subunit RsxC [Melioribacteraceae bacterium]|nr:electron transport complex subunit RsxC [Melioribacteraceae bacterium]
MALLEKLKTFMGGVHPPEHKELSENIPFEKMPVPKEIFIPLSQHIGKPANALVKKGSEVKAGTVVAESSGFISAPIHSSVAGKVTKIASGANLSGYSKEGIIIKPDEEQETEKMSLLNPATITPEEIRNRVKEAGIVGQGGAAFPTFVKLTPPKGAQIEYIILNGCECEPYLTRDFRFMIEMPEKVVSGLKLIMKALNVDRGVIGIESNKPEAAKKINEAIKGDPTLSVEVLETKYPQGAEKMLIKAITNREVPPGRLPLDVGCVIQNIGTAVAVHDAVAEGTAGYTAALTVTGKGIMNPKNLLVPVGTSIGEVIEYCGGLNEDAIKVIAGGPMMGFAQHDMSAPVTKATSGILVLTKEEVNNTEETACLRCGKCVEVCPLGLLPTRLSRLSQLEKYEEADEIGITVCMECGSCTYTCPANIPLVQWIRLGKQAVIKLQRENKTA